MKTMKELFEMGYKITVGSMWGDVLVEDLEHVEDYMKDTELEELDEEAKTAYFYEVDEGQYDE